jgi:hypothetical protein
MSDYTTIFDISHKSFQWWFPAFGLVIGVAGILILRLHKADYKWAYGLAAVSILWSLFSFSGIASGDREFQKAYASGNYMVVEGPVENYWEGVEGKEECFSVQSKQFCYSDNVITPGFRNSAWHGGPIRPRLPVRVSYNGDTILKLEIRSDSAPTRNEVRIRTLESIGRYLFPYAAFGVIALAINGAVWAYERLRRRVRSRTIH